MARAIASTTPVRIPGAAAGSTTLHAVRHLGAPSASAASFRPWGTRRRTSSEERTTIGNMMIARAIAPASSENCCITTTMPR